MIGQVFTRLQLMFAHATASLVSHDKVQVEALADEPLENIARVEPYGLSYRPKAGSQPYIVFPGGDRSYGVALVIGDTRYQMTLAEGEVALHDDEGNWVHIKRGGTIEVKASNMVVADTPLFKTTHDAEIGGNLVVMGMTTSVIGYGGAGGGAALMNSGARIIGELTSNGKDVSSHHTHTSTAPGTPTSEVN